MYLITCFEKGECVFPGHVEGDLLVQLEERDGGRGRELRHDRGLRGRTAEGEVGERRQQRLVVVQRHEEGPPTAGRPHGRRRPLQDVGDREGGGLRRRLLAGGGRRHLRRQLVHLGRHLLETLVRARGVDSDRLREMRRDTHAALPPANHPPDALILVGPADTNTHTCRRRFSPPRRCLRIPVFCLTTRRSPKNTTYHPLQFVLKGLKVGYSLKG